MTAIQIPREKVEFITGEGMLNFINAHAGTAQPSFNPGSYAYKVEMVMTPAELAHADNQAMLTATSLVASTYDTSPTQQDQFGQYISGWQKHIYGSKGKFPLLEQTDRELAKYPYAQGKHVFGFSQVWNPKTLGFTDPSFNLSIPDNRTRFDMALAAKAPGVHRFADLNNQEDINKIYEINQMRQAKGLPVHSEANFGSVLIPVASHEVWSGCFGRVSGRAYWSTAGKNKVNFALSHILLTRQGERVGGSGESSPDAAFGAFAPPASLAPRPLTNLQMPAPPVPPAPPAPPVVGFGGLI